MSLMSRAAVLLKQSTQHRLLSTSAAGLSAALSSASDKQEIKWVFLGPPGVGKGTYASRVAKLLGVPHIATGDLVREEVKRGTDLGRKMQDIVNQGHLLTDSLILEVLYRRLESGKTAGEKGFVLDGFPRTHAQAQELLSCADVGLAVNLQLREEVLLEKCMGRRNCTHCGKGYNIADIHLPASNGFPEIIMPPLSAPPECIPHLQTREDDTEKVIRARLAAYNAQSAPVEKYFRTKGKLLEFQISGGIPETLPNLLAALQPWIPRPPTAAPHVIPAEVADRQAKAGAKVAVAGL
ncbi:MAG: hypothetical protein WDW38_002702 [Sanguina aurantia]